jgi:hypothetical protein
VDLAAVYCGNIHTALWNISRLVISAIATSCASNASAAALLDARQFPLKLEPKRFSTNTLVFNLDRDPIVAQ